MQIDEKLVAELFGLDEAEVSRVADGANGQSLNDLVRERYKREMEALARALYSDDDLVKVIRAHIHIEHELQRVIFCAVPNPDQLNSFERSEFSDEVRLALLLGLRPDLKPSLNAAGNLRNKFAHQLDTTLTQEVAKNLVATLSSELKARFQAIAKDALASPQLRPLLETSLIEAGLGRLLPQLAAAAHPFDMLEGEAQTLAHARLDVMNFFLCLFEALANERHRLAIEKIHRLQAP